MKPIEEDELPHTIDRIKRLRVSNLNNSESEQSLLLRQMRTEGYRYRERFLVPYKDGFEVVNVNDIAFITDDHNASFDRHALWS